MTPAAASRARGADRPRPPTRAASRSIGQFGGRCHDCCWTRPGGGLFVWITLPEGVDAAPLLERAVRDVDVAFVPGAAFHPRGGGANTLSLSYSLPSAGAIREGVKRLASLI